MLYQVVSREQEIELLSEKLSSPKAEFIAVYGRRRVGKTYLIKQFFSNQDGVFFEQTGLNKGSLSKQLRIFAQSMSRAFYQGIKISVPEDWLEALEQLTIAIDNIPSGKRIFLFFDELPWLSSKKSGFLAALDHYWNTRWSNRQKLILIVCGSAASWMLDKIVYAKGGLHNRITLTLPLKPFTLQETQKFLNYRKVQLNHRQLLELYMVTGGVPHYLEAVRNGLSAAQNVNAMCFKSNGILFDEFDNLLSSLYENSQLYAEILKTIAKHSDGVSRDELVAKVEAVSEGGRLTTRLSSLEAAGFIAAFTPIGRAKKGTYYRVIDEYTLFYFTWIEPLRKQSRLVNVDSHYWEHKANSSLWHSWCGYAFEAACFKHVQSIRKTLGIDHISSEFGSWRYQSTQGSNERGAQIDMLFDRSDGCITICEIKYTSNIFTIDKHYAEVLKRKVEVFKTVTKTTKQIFIAMICAHGLKKNAYSEELISCCVTLEDLLEA